MTHRRMTSRFFFCLAGAALLGATGCGASTDNDNAAAALDSLESASTEGTFLALGLEGADTSMTGDALAQSAATRTTQLLTPAGCVQALAAGNVVTYSFEGCSGPYGLVRVSGTATLTFTNSNGTVQASLVANSLRVNGAFLDLRGTARFSSSGGSRTAAVQASTSGTGARGTDFSRTGNYTVVWTDTCLEIDGAWQTTGFGRSWTTTVADFRHCTGQCPAAGGVITLSGARLASTLTLTYDGDNTASWTSSGGRSGVIPISCG